MSTVLFSGSATYSPKSLKVTYFSKFYFYFLWDPTRCICILQPNWHYGKNFTGLQWPCLWHWWSLFFWPLLWAIAMWLFAIPCFQPCGPLHFMEILTEGRVRADRDAKWERGMLYCSQANHDNSSGHDTLLNLEAHFFKVRSPQCLTCLCAQRVLDERIQGVFQLSWRGYWLLALDVLNGKYF